MSEVREAMSGATYQAARVVAETVRDYFARRLAAARERRPQVLAPEADAATIEAIIDAAFWASLRREEGYSPKISLAFLPPEEAGQPLHFEKELPLSAGALAKVAPAVERPGLHLGVWRDPGGELRVWGTTRSIPKLCFVLEVVEPGLLVVKYRRGQEASKFVNVAVLQGDQIKIVDERGTSLPDCPELLTSLLGFGAPAPVAGAEPVNALVQLAASMRAHRRGGSLLVVPHGSENWRESILRPVTYAVAPAFSELAELMRRDAEEKSRQRWQEAFIDAVDAIAGLTAVDGATVISDRFELLAFGAKIGRRDGGAQVTEVILTEPVIDGEAEPVHPTRLGGTRHLSAAQFVHDQTDAVALVASQDGRFTVFAWSPCENRVHAHRVDILLM